VKSYTEEMLAEVFLQAALHFLSNEVPGWERANRCYSCHNNGDAARALYLAKRKGHDVDGKALADTTRWLLQPARWGDIHGAPAASDKNLARVQFAGALAEAYRSGATSDRKTLIEAAESLLPIQAADGSFPIDTGGMPGAPATYGTALATTMSRRTLQTADAEHFARVIARADRWLSVAKPASITDAAALLLGAPARQDCQEAILKSQTSDGGWGPQPKAPAEAFDTALAILALVQANGPADAIERGRQFLIRIQDSAGAWPETTRPSGGISYAERMSTTGWVTYALLVSSVR
jgi:hypothetical protein